MQDAASCTVSGPVYTVKFKATSARLVDARRAKSEEDARPRRESLVRGIEIAALG